jgi:DNA-binding transcriptional LysR family regulator
MRDLDLKSLRLFAAVCDCASIKDAATREHIEPSAISKRLAQLEDQLGIQLLVRGRSGVELTPAGQGLLEHVRSLMFTMQRIQGDMDSFKGGVKGHVRLVASASAIAESLLDDVAAFMRRPENKDIKVDIEELLSVDLIRAVSSGTASLGVCWDNADFEALEHLPYRSDQLALAVHRDHALANKRSIKFTQSLAFEHVGLSPNTAVYRLMQKAATKDGKSILYRCVVSNFDAAFRVVAANLGVSVVPIQVGTSYEKIFDIKLIPLMDKWAVRNFAICFDESAKHQPAVARLLNFLSSFQKQSLSH